MDNKTSGGIALRGLTGQWIAGAFEQKCAASNRIAASAMNAEYWWISAAILT